MVEFATPLTQIGNTPEYLMIENRRPAKIYFVKD